MDKVNGDRPPVDGNTVTVSTPEQASGMNVAASVYLCAYRRDHKGGRWYSGHAGQLARRYVGLTRASGALYLIKEGTPDSVNLASGGDEFWERVANHLGQPSPLDFKDIQDFKF